MHPLQLIAIYIFPLMDELPIAVAERDESVHLKR